MYLKAEKSEFVFLVEPGLSPDIPGDMRNAVISNVVAQWGEISAPGLIPSSGVQCFHQKEAKEGGVLR